MRPSSVPWLYSIIAGPCPVQLFFPAINSSSHCMSIQKSSKLPVKGHEQFEWQQWSWSHPVSCSSWWELDQKGRDNFLHTVGPAPLHCPASLWADDFLVGKKDKSHKSLWWLNAECSDFFNYLELLFSRKREKCSARQPWLFIRWGQNQSLYLMHWVVSMQWCSPQPPCQAGGKF